MAKNTTKARVALKKAVQSKQRQRKDPLFTFKKWSLIQFDDMNIKLVHEDDGTDKVRYYSNLKGAMYGLAKEIGFKSKTLNEAIQSYEKLSTTIATLNL